MTGALSQEAPDASLIRRTRSQQNLFSAAPSQAIVFVIGSCAVHLGLWAFALWSPNALDEAVASTNDFQVDLIDEEPKDAPEEKLAPLGQLDESLPVATSPPPLTRPPTPTVPSPPIKQEHTTPEILGAEPAEAPTEPSTHTFNPYAQRDSSHFTKGSTVTRTPPVAAAARFGTKNGSSDASLASGEALKKWYGTVRSELAAKALSNYPKRAKKLGIAGSLKLNISLSPSGKLLSVRLQNSSGSPILDQAAIASVRGIANLPKPPPGTGRTDFIVPVKFRLR